LFAVYAGSLLGEGDEFKERALLRHMGLGGHAIVAGGTNRGHGRDIDVVIRTGEIGSGQDRCRQGVFFQGHAEGTAVVTSGAIGQIVRAVGQADLLSDRSQWFAVS
jgi:hypothetical protein